MKDRRLFYSLNLTLFLLFTLWGCRTLVKVSNLNLQNIYKQELSEINPEVIIYHQNDEESILYFRIKSDELHYIKKPDEAKFKSKITLSYNIITSYNSTKPLDSASVLLIDSVHFESGKYIQDSIVFKAKSGNDYIMHLKIIDHNKKSELSYIYEIKKQHAYSSQNFKIYNSGGEMAFSNFIANSSVIKLNHNSKADFQMNAMLISEDLKPARPPFLEETITDEEINTKSIGIIKFIDGEAIVNIDKNGHCRFFHGDETFNGFSLFYFHDGYPKLTSYQSMLNPIRYIVSNTEFSAVSESADLRGAIDRFWVGVAGDPVRARSLVSRYYNNVQLSNIFFTSYKEGWKTDRGMIYTIFGAPDIVILNDGFEVWHYKDTWRMNELQFEFIKKSHPYSDNHYVLKRKADYRNPWYLGIENWRK
ncbi:MAG: GWxTD domain-containing protein [Bacteroidetes bacterium]|nr:GWxTD domain-containing protein [Bacteroidota bacterium]